MPGQKIRIVDADNEDVPPGESGEVLVHGPNVMRGYLNRPDETAKTLVDGWLHTGDIGYFDGDGYLVLVDRAKDMIIRGGENIYPKEIETVVYQLPEVAEAAVVGRAHPVYGEEPVLFVSLNSGAAVSTDGIVDHLSGVAVEIQTPRGDHDSRRPAEEPGRQDRQTHAAEIARSDPLIAHAKTTPDLA